MECCKFCGVPVPGTYYRLDIHLACIACAGKVRRQRNGVFLRSLAFGLAAALAGFAMYATVEMATGWMASAVSLVVGVMVGKAMMVGSGGSGERRYQYTAALLTYAAFAMATVPVSMVYAAKPSIEQRVAASNRTTANFDVPSHSFGGSPSPALPTRAASILDQPFDQPHRFRLVLAVAAQLLAGLASPFVVLTHHFYQALLMAMILLFGTRSAWKTAKGKQQPVLYGPF